MLIKIALKHAHFMSRMLGTVCLYLKLNAGKENCMNTIVSVMVIMAVKIYGTCMTICIPYTDFENLSTCRYWIPSYRAMSGERESTKVFHY
jgi:hypothetical protein